MQPSQLLDFIAALLAKPGVNLMDISRRSGVSYSILRALRAGKRPNCTVQTLDAIWNVLMEGRDDILV